MTFETWLLFVAVAIAPALSPGPGILLAITNTLRYGAWAVPYSAAGNSLGLMAMGFAVAFGLAALMVVWPWAVWAVKLLGGAYLVYLGVKLWRRPVAMRVEAGHDDRPRSRRSLFGEALMVSLTNPKALALMAALLPPFVPQGPLVITHVTILSVTYGGMCFLNHLAIGHFGGRLRRFLSSEARVVALSRTLGVAFIGFGLALASANR